MMRLLHVIIVLVVVFLVPGNNSFAQDILIFSNNNKAPKVYEENGLPKGILVDIMEAIGPDINIYFKIQLYPWNRAYILAERGKGAIMALSKTEERLKIFDYSEPMYYDENVLVVLKGREFPFEKIEDLKNKKIGFQKGTSYGDEFEKAKKDIFNSLEDMNPKERLHNLLRGVIDAALIGGPGTMGLNSILKKDSYLNSQKDKFTVLDKAITRDANHIGFAKTMNQKSLIEEINKALKKAWESGKIQEIIDKHVNRKQD